MTDGDSLTFEDALAQLNQIVERLETGELSLDETLALYEQGQELAKFCEDALTQAELRLEALRPVPGGYERVPVDEDPDA